MTPRENRIKVYLPLAFSMVMIAGILLGYWLTPGNIFPEGLIPMKKYRTDKLNDVVNYVYFEYVDSVNRNTLVEEAIGGVLGKLDPHSQYITAEEFNDVNDPLIGNFEGIGIEFRIIDDSITVIWCIEGGPSREAGILPGDRIVAVDDSSFTGAITNHDVMRKLKGPGGSSVKVGVFRRSHEGLIDFDLIRKVIPTSSIDSYFMATDETAYLKLSRFAANTYDEFSDAVSFLLSKEMKNLILDLRGNVGGYLQSAIKIADEFLEKDLMIVYTEGYNRPRTEYRASSNGRCENVGLNVLIDGHSASASEIIAGAIQDNDRGLIIGRRSYGKGLVQEQIDFSDGSALRLTVARYYTPTGRCIQKPYSNPENNFEDYYNESYLRYVNGELENPDSIHFNDSLKYITPAGKTVYGGGGIMPDIYIPVKSDSGYTYYNKLMDNEIFLKFVFDYEHKYEPLLQKYPSVEEFVSGFTLSDGMLEDFTSYAGKRGVKFDEAGYEFAREKIANLLEAYFARIRFGDAGFFPVYLRTDKIYLRSLEKFSGS